MHANTAEASLPKAKKKANPDVQRGAIKRTDCSGERKTDFNFRVLASHEAWMFWELPPLLIYKFPSSLKLVKAGFILCH